MSQSQDEARAARIQKYKEERRKQLTARTATLFSANVTERRPRKVGDRCQSDDVAEHLKSSSELNLNTASTSVPIRTTRTSRLRAAATVHSDSSPSPKKSNRSSSVQSLNDDAKTKASKLSRIIDRDKPKITRRQSNEKENLKTTTDKDIGAFKTKPKHSTNKTILEKDKSNFIVNSPKRKSNPKLDGKKNRNSLVEQKNIGSLQIGDKSKKNLHIDEEEILNDILDDKGLSDSLEKEKIEDLFNDLVVENKNNFDDKIGLKDYIPINQEENAVNKVVTIAKLESSGVVPKIVKVEEVGLGGVGLGAVCVRKVERFSELLSNLCSPCEADILFQDILAENGIDGNSVSMDLDLNDE